ncbi:type II restriction endonuclease [Erwinia psidii]|uniref:Type II restriction endonuclease n=1 Tax=Erwinia psidii TaxID=69224 RepID=A0A3N6UUR3_9GAMM|nr:type II restriction endonuclease [Erwinia psidii]MCX8957489.1 type II restriction endonuclease [Erwinia psidii]MCX8960542.1 type II restriction endonuclease [Erwinia psidii]MCX8964213.1 type II restriction endonuclease [Erwinia psidii]RQM39689.1 type II restriction endonuclease [Erwinia psidii]
MNNKRETRNKGCIKRLTKVEADRNASNQHEFNGVASLKSLFGDQKREVMATFMIEGEALSSRAKVTWYEARERHKTRSEYRLYFQDNRVMDRACEGDNIYIGFDNDNLLNCILIPRKSSSYVSGINKWKPI